MRSGVDTPRRLLAISYAARQLRARDGHLAVALADRQLPLCEFEEALSVLSGRLAQALYSGLQQMARDYAENFNEAAMPEVPVRDVCRSSTSTAARCRRASGHPRLLRLSHRCATSPSSTQTARPGAPSPCCSRSCAIISGRTQFRAGATRTRGRACAAAIRTIWSTCLTFCLARRRAAEKSSSFARCCTTSRGDRGRAQHSVQRAGERRRAGISHVLGQLGGGVDAFIPVLTELAGLSDKASPVALAAPRAAHRAVAAIPGAAPLTQIEHASRLREHGRAPAALRSSPMRDLLLSFLSQPVHAVRRGGHAHVRAQDVPNARDSDL